jgi:hypothetical protein
MRFPISYDPTNLKANQEEVTKLLSILAETEQDSYFKTSYIQQLIDYQWESSLKKAYSIVLFCYIGVYVLLMTGSLFLNGSDDVKENKIRLGISIPTTVLVCGSVGAFEVRQLIVSKWEYF